MGGDNSSNSGALLRVQVLQAQADMAATGARLRDYRGLLQQCHAQKLPVAEVAVAVEHAQSAYRIARRLYAAAVKQLARHDAQHMADPPSVAPTAKKDDPA